LTPQELGELRRQVDLARGFGKNVKDKLPVANTPNAFQNPSVAKSATDARPDAAIAKPSAFVSKSTTELSPNAALLAKSASPSNAAAPAVAINTASPFATTKSNVSARAQAAAPANSPFATLPAAPPKNSYTEQKLANKLEPHTHRIGGDYATGNVASAQLCQLVCEREGQCKSWTYVTQTAQCQLKSVVPAKTEGSCCVAGVK
jgi:hypothetical protein